MTTWPPKESISNLNMKPKGNTPLLLSTRLDGLTLWSVLCSQSLYFNPKSNNRVSALRGELKPLGFLPSSRPVERLSWTSAGGPAAMGKQAWCGQPDSWARSCRNACSSTLTHRRSTTPLDVPKKNKNMNRRGRVSHGKGRKSQDQAVWAWKLLHKSKQPTFVLRCFSTTWRQCRYLKVQPWRTTAVMNRTSLRH